jgi:hypothetical protein
MKKQALEKFISELTKAEGGKSQIHIGDARQIIKMADKALGGIIYKAIELKYKPKEK